MNDFDELWKAIEAKYPQIATGKVQMTSKGFKRALELSFRKGVESRKDTSINNMFDRMFGGRG